MASRTTGIDLGRPRTTGSAGQQQHFEEEDSLGMMDGMYDEGEEHPSFIESFDDGGEHESQEQESSLDLDSQWGNGGGFNMMDSLLEFSEAEESQAEIQLRELSVAYGETQHEVRDLEKRIQRRTLLVDTLRTAYLKDVVTLKHVLMDVLTSEERRAAVSEYNSRLPSVDLRRPLQLYGPKDAELRVLPCAACGGVVDVTMHDSDAADRMQKAIKKLRAKVCCESSLSLPHERILYTPTLYFYLRSTPLQKFNLLNPPFPQLTTIKFKTRHLKKFTPKKTGREAPRTTRHLRRQAGERGGGPPRLQQGAWGGEALLVRRAQEGQRGQRQASERQCAPVCESGALKGFLALPLSFQLSFRTVSLLSLCRVPLSCCLPGPGAPLKFKSKKSLLSTSPPPLQTHTHATSQTHTCRPIYPPHTYTLKERIPRNGAQPNRDHQATRGQGDAAAAGGAGAERAQGVLWGHDAATLVGAAGRQFFQGDFLFYNLSPLCPQNSVDEIEIEIEINSPRPNHPNDYLTQNHNHNHTPPQPRPR